MHNAQVELESVKLVVGYRDPATGVVYDHVIIREMDGGSDKLLTKPGDTSFMHRMTLVAARNLVSASGPGGALVDFRSDRTPKATAFAAGLALGDRMRILARLGMVSFGNAGRMKAECAARVGDKKCGSVEHIYVSPTEIGMPRKAPPKTEGEREPELEDAGDGLLAVEEEEPDFSGLLVPGEFIVSFLVYRDAARRYHAARPDAVIPGDATEVARVKYHLDTQAIVDLAEGLPDEAEPWLESLVRLHSITFIGPGESREFTPGRVVDKVTKINAEDEAYSDRLPVGFRRIINSAIGAIRDCHWDWRITYRCKKCKSEQEFTYSPLVAFLGQIAT